MTKDVYTVKDIAEQLQVTERSVRQAIADGRLKAKKALNKWVIPAAEFERFISSQEEEGA